MVKIRQETINNLSHSEILIQLSLNTQDYKELSKKSIDKTPQTIFRHIQLLKKEKWILKNNMLNYDKLTDEFIFFLKDYVVNVFFIEEITQFIDHNKDKIIKEEYIKNLLKIFIRHYAEHKKKNSNITLKHIFEEIISSVFIYLYATTYLRRAIIGINKQNISNKVNVKEEDIQDFFYIMQDNFPITNKLFLLLLSSAEYSEFALKKIDFIPKNAQEMLKNKYSKS